MIVMGPTEKILVKYPARGMTFLTVLLIVDAMIYDGNLHIMKHDLPIFDSSSDTKLTLPIGRAVEFRQSRL